jgi:hypothetical protein
MRQVSLTALTYSHVNSQYHIASHLSTTNEEQSAHYTPLERESHSKNKTKGNGNVIESSVTRVVRKAHLTFTADI